MFVTVVAKVTAHLKTRCSTVLTVGKSHAENTACDTRDLISTVPTVTLFIFNASLAVHPFTDISTVTQIFLPAAEQYLFQHPLLQKQITVHNAQYFLVHNHKLFVSQPFVATSSQIGVFAMLLFPIVGK
jgi:hypothetical protein